jgi:hypothetical protein
MGGVTSLSGKFQGAVVQKPVSLTMGIKNSKHTLQQL